MRLVRKEIDTRHGTGYATLIPQEPEDMWHLYNLIQPYDSLRAPAVRKVKTTSASGATSSSTVRTNLTIKVKSTDFDAGAGELHVSGRVSQENEYVPLGSHHTLDLELHRQFTLSKEGFDGAGGWDTIALQQLKEATDARRAAQAFAVVMDLGLANICFLTENQTLLRQRVEVSFPTKTASSEAVEKARKRFFDTTLSTLLRQLDLPSIVAEGKNPPLLLASPGLWVAEGFKNYILETATRDANKDLLRYARSAIIVARSSSGHVHALAEVLQDPTVRGKMSETKYAKDMRYMEKFRKLAFDEQGWAWYGPKEVEKVVDRGAVGRGGGVLLIGNKLFRAQDVKIRQRWVNLVERVRNDWGGEVRILSSEHSTGKQLEELGNIGAILTYPIPDVDDSDGEEEDDVQEEQVQAIGNGGDQGNVWDEDFDTSADHVNGQSHDRVAENIDI